jgi:FtsH-binding integral membrane protein
VIGGIVASLVWFLAGKQSLSNGKPNAAIGWQSVAVFVMLVFLGWMTAEGEWLGSVFSIGVICFELWSIRKILSAQKEKNDRG